MPTPQQLLALYTDALGHLENGYLVKGQLWDGFGGFCARGAILEADPGRDYYSNHRECDAPLVEAMGSLAPARGCFRLHADAGGDDIALWNNAEETTKEDVVMAFELAIEALTAQIKAEVEAPELAAV